MDWWGVLYIVIGLWLVSRAISSMRAGTSSTFFNLLWLAGGAYVIYLGYQKVTAPAPGLLPTMGGRR
jgi:threonine/homoserine/homoserine lactone efflux protein